MLAPIDMSNNNNPPMYSCFGPLDNGAEPSKYIQGLSLVKGFSDFGLHDIKNNIVITDEDYENKVAICDHGCKIYEKDTKETDISSICPVCKKSTHGYSIFFKIDGKEKRVIIPTDL